MSVALESLASVPKITNSVFLLLIKRKLLRVHVIHIELQLCYHCPKGTSQGLLSKIVGLKSIDRASVGSPETCMSLTRYDVMFRNGYNVSTISFERGFFILRDNIADGQKKTSKQAYSLSVFSVKA